jgi:GrpB-like predicted nucleotidyltransferase (UPF0157 family)
MMDVAFRAALDLAHKGSSMHRATRDVRDFAERLSPWALTPIEHIGSTAIPQLPAKPATDLMVAVRSFDVVPEMSMALTTVGWHLVPPDLDERPSRRFFVKVVGGRRTAHLHVMVVGEPRWTEQLVFHDRLRPDMGLRDEYAQLKIALAERHRTNARDTRPPRRSSFATLCTRAGQSVDRLTRN